jgi:D-glycero-alpha-D-manno-heptose-7-phosphate kinase
MPFKGLAIHVSTEAPVGSGLGTSSTIVVSLCGAFLKLYGLPLGGALKIAEYAYQIERVDLGWVGGRQDQYAAIIGGFNHFIFTKEGDVVIDRISAGTQFVSLLEQSIVLYYSNQQRNSGTIIEEQQDKIAP